MITVSSFSIFRYVLRRSVNLNEIALISQISDGSSRSFMTACYAKHWEIMNAIRRSGMANTAGTHKQQSICNMSSDWKEGDKIPEWCPVAGGRDMGSRRVIVRICDGEVGNEWYSEFQSACNRLQSRHAQVFPVRLNSHLWTIDLSAFPTQLVTSINSTGRIDSTLFRPHIR